MEFKDTGLPSDPAYIKAFEFGTQIYQSLNYDKETADQIYQAIAISSLKLLQKYYPEAPKSVIIATLLGPLGAEYVTDQGHGFHADFGPEVMGIVSSISRKNFPSSFQNDCREEDQKLYMMVNLVTAIEKMGIPRVEAGLLDDQQIKDLFDDMTKAYRLFKGEHPVFDKMMKDALLKMETFSDLCALTQNTKRSNWIAGPKG